MSSDPSSAENPGPLLALESSCDETAVAVIAADRTVRAAALASQTELHAPFRGVVPELAARMHVERFVPLIDEVMRQAGIRGPDLSAVAVTNTPGLAGSLLVGLTTAKALCVAWQRPLIVINHLHAHLYACQMIHPERSVFPAVGLVISGGHCSLYRCHTAVEFEYLGGTIDDAVGEAYDKVAAMLGLPFPGGPALAAAAAAGNPRAYSFPRSMIDEASGLDFSFSGLKTAVRYTLVGPGERDFSSLRLSPQQIADVAASFQQAVIDVVCLKAERALQQTSLPRLLCGGGVAANSQLRQTLAERLTAAGQELIVAPPALCTDNAVMGALAWEYFERGEFSRLDVDILPGLQRGA
jgi:N6-L-threonylcarbamoyladenine synthase